MLHTRFDALREQLLKAGIAPRHVRRYLAELSDHFDDLVREEKANGAALAVAELKARTRLGSDSELAAGMLARPDLRSLAARYPWAVFGLSPIVMVAGALAVCLALEIALFLTIGKYHPPAAQRDAFIFAINAWNTLWTTVAPFMIAVALVVLGLKQRTPPVWIFVGIAAACFFGAFQVVSFSDDGLHGELSFGSAFFPPFPMTLIVGGLYRLAVTVGLAGALYWFGLRRQNAADRDEPVALAAE